MMIVIKKTKRCGLVSVWYTIRVKQQKSDAQAKKI